MNTDVVVADFKMKVSKQITLEEEGVKRYRVFTPFRFDDGDHLSIVLKESDAGWILSDEGSTYQHLTYDLDAKDLFKGNRQQIISNALSLYNVRDVEGQLQIVINEHGYGNALYSFSQALLKIMDVTFLSRETVRSTFREDFTTLINTFVSPQRSSFDWYDTQRDPEGKYKVDCKVNSMARPLFIFACQNDNKVMESNITLLQFENWRMSFNSIAIFEEQESISRKDLARFSDVCDKLFSSLAAEDRIKHYIERYMHV